ncbi:MAG TPA: EAL domain-containing protein [Gammaproteobacteria bacterium]|nr:EAL domain-containing protein [Gammaproteobacteria bacterium]
MPLSRKIGIVISCLIAVIYAGSMLISITSVRAYLQDQLISNAQDTATSLGLSLGPVMAANDQPLAAAMINAIFDPGYYQKIELRSADNKSLVRRERAVSIEGVPNWFVQVIPLHSPAASAEIMSGWQIGGSVSVQSHPGYAYLYLWQRTVETFWWFIGGLALLLAAVAVSLRYLLSPLKQVEGQARAIANLDFVDVEEIPKTRELKSVVLAMNKMSGKLRQMVSSQTELAEQMRREAYQDSVTNLPNRRQFNTEFEQWLTDTDHFDFGAILLLEIADFKAFNDQCGYVVGDQRLCRIADFLGHYCAELAGEKILARLGGASFILVIDGMDRQEAETACDHILQGLVEIDSTGDKSQVRLQANIGVALCQGNGQPGDLLGLCDLALRTAQQQGSNRWFVKESVSLQSALPRSAQAWSEWLDQIIAKQAIEFCLQPVKELRQDRLLHREVLLRARDLDGSYVSAGVFLPMAWRYDRMLQLDRLVVSKILERLVSDHNSRLAVNISDASMRSMEFVDWLSVQLTRFPEQAAMLDLEITATAADQSLPQCQVLRKTLTANASHLGIDHFGRGQGYFGYLATLKPDYVKVDGSYITAAAENADVRFFLQTVAGIIHGLDGLVIAEHVEHKDHLQWVSNNGFDAAQGYEIGRPDVVDN